MLSFVEHEQRLAEVYAIRHEFRNNKQSICNQFVPPVQFFLGASE